MKRSLVLASVAALLAARASESQDRLPPESLKLEEALALALAHHPLLERTAHEVRAAEQAVREARSSYFPQLYLQGIAKDGLSGATGGLGLVGLPASPFFDKLRDSRQRGLHRAIMEGRPRAAGSRVWGRPTEEDTPPRRSASEVLQGE